MTDILSIKRYTDWLNKSIRGDRITYYRGFLFAPKMQRLSPTLDDRRVEGLKKFVYNSYLSNTVTLTQKRHGKFDYEYIAVRV